MANVLVQLLMMSWLSVAHPFYVSMTDINHNTSTKELEVSVRIFTDDLEATLRKTFGGKIDVLHPQDKNKMNQMITTYIQSHLQLQVDGKPVQLSFVGYEQQEESIWTYMEVKNVASVKKLSLKNNLLHDYNTNQINMMHVKANGKEQSYKLDYPNTDVTFTW